MDNVRQVALITGGLSGIGLSAAIQMLERGGQAYLQLK